MSEVRLLRAREEAPIRKRVATEAELMARADAHMFEKLREEDDDAGLLDEVKRKFMQSAGDAEHDHLQYAMTDGDLMALEPPSWVVQDWIPRGFYSDLFGEPGAKKTFAILDLVRCVRAGLDWHGHSVEPGATLFYQGEGAEQLVDRTRAWNSWHSDPSVASGWTFAHTADVGTPEGVAAIVRTARGLPLAEDERLQMIAFDPAVEYMSGEENGEGMERLTRGLRIIAQMLDVGVAVGHHTNATGERARGSDHMRMRSGAHIRVEQVELGYVGLVQQKQKNGEMRALILQPVESAGSLALHTIASLTAAEYAARKKSKDNAANAERRLEMSSSAAQKKDQLARELLLRVVTTRPGLGKGALTKACLSQGAGKDVLERVLEVLVEEGAIRRDAKGSGANSPQRHYPREPSDP
ncbi:AAA family ATPase [Curtobacterium sp. VKM Ac-2884]|uniref:AAA family ATPase n=1 Tax=Curtobacterium sp. VKM Ac-2884 TaxID=2783818 RepID=UPI00188C3C8D|nr:AAA family ATPase [Curtobacterium sp. VKM Ac-2884]MBF4604709.1 AAA family ATPase [Curtobacterium sp. VKM Ac-2884]